MYSVFESGLPKVDLPSFDRLVADCAKLKQLDELLVKLKRDNHRVLIFCQMTRMIDILEEYMAKKHYSYFRMDGSTNIADRRDMVNEYQVNYNIFAFLLSTRAGGLGVNLTGADTVIFYDNDWNPTMDAQATDRAHRIGQTRKVSVYRLVTKNTIEERIVKRAKQKQSVQSTVYSGGAFKADIFKQSDVSYKKINLFIIIQIVELLYSEEEVKKLEEERKKLSLNISEKLNDNIIDLNEKDNLVKLDETNTKKKGKKGKKEEKTKKEEKVKKEKLNKKNETNVINNNKNNINGLNAETNQKPNLKNIFSVSNGSTKINAMKVDR